MTKQVSISGWCVIRNNQVWVNGELVFDGQPANDFGEFSKAAFKALEQSYLKFYKMDNLSKLGFLCAEYLLQRNPINSDNKPVDTGIILTNAASCIDTDVEHEKTIADSQNYFPSPSIFVYTLPNIVIGEISIKHKFQGENTFFIFDQFNAEFLSDYVNGLFRQNRLKTCITGWVDLLPRASAYEAVFCLTEVSDKKDMQAFNTENLKKIYKQ